MKSQFFLLNFFLLVLASMGFAQTANNKVALEIALINNQYRGDYGNGLWNFSDTAYPGVGLNLSYYLNPSFNIGIEGSYGNYGYRKSDVDRFSLRKLDAYFHVDYQLNNAFILIEQNKLSPFLTLGIGLAAYNDKFRPEDEQYLDRVTSGYDGIIPIGIGLKYEVSKRFALKYKYLYNFTNRDLRDENRGADNPIYQSIPGNDSYGKHVLSLAVTLGREFFYQPYHWR